MTLEGKSALVTGSGRGIGKGIAISLAQQGCNIVVNYFRNRDDAEETAATVESLGVKSVVIKANIGEEEQVQRLMEKSAAAFGGIDILVGNAASGILRPITEIDSKAWDWTVNINAKSILLCAQAAVPYMKIKGWGRILTVTSLGSRRVFPRYGAVGISKAAIETITRYLAVELAPFGITCNCISPGLVLTGALKHFPNKAQMIDFATHNTPAGRLVTPEDVGDLAAWLCSDAASMIVGQTIEIDGGYSLLATE